MPIAWTIQGEAGKTLDATVRTLESLAIDTASLNFRSLDADELTITISPKDVTTTMVAELGQTVTLFRNGTRFFHGHVIDNPVQITSSAQTVSIVIAGPWWWLDRINLTSSKTDATGATADRMSYIFGTTSGGVNLKTAIENLMDRAIALGAPFQRGSVATFFDVPRITLNQCSCAQALSELIRLVPDTMTYFDYSTTPPTMIVTRRSTATVETLTVGTSPIESISIKPLWEMKVDQVVLDYNKHDVRGLTQYVAQTSGTAAPARIHKLTVSGQELDTFIPNSVYDRYNLKTTPISLSDDFIIQKDSDCAAAIKKYGTLPVAVGPYSIGTSGVATAKSTSYLLEDGTYANLTGKYLITGENPPSWDTGYNFEKVTITGDIYYLFASSKSTRGGGISTYYSLPAWWYEIPWVKKLVAVSSQTFGIDTYTYDFFSKPFSISGYLVNGAKPVTAGTGTGNTTTQFTMPAGFETSDNYYVGVKVQIGENPTFTYTITAYVGSTRRATISGTFPVAMNGFTFYLINGCPIYKPADFSFIAPPAGLAENLKGAQDFVPYAGSIDLKEQDVGGTRYRGKVVNIANSFTAYSTMKALVSSESLDIKSGGTSIELGTPPRLDFRSFTDRIRRTPQDNFEYL
jgi:hypothetical protein